MMPAVTTEPENTEKSDARIRRSRGIYLLPNLLTTGCLFSGFYAIVAAIDKQLRGRPAWRVFVAMIFDGLDGRVARWTRTESAFGKEYDSLADMVAFGVAPAIVVYQWGVVRIGEYGHAWGRFGWLVAFFYAAVRGAAPRALQRALASGDKRYFEGLPSPSAAAIVAAFVWFFAQVARAGPAGPDAGVRGHRLRRGADGVSRSAIRASSRSTWTRASSTRTSRS